MALTEGQKKAAEKNRKYWEQRELEQKKHNITEEKEYSKHLNKIYEDMLDNVQKEIDAFYGKYAKAEGITIAEAKKRVSQLDIEAYERKAKRYVECTSKDYETTHNVILAAIEYLLSCVVADGMINGHHRSNTELVAQGAGNIASALFGGIPATGAIARTAANVKNGGRTPIAGMVHAVTLLLVLVVLMPYAGLIPMPTIAAILFMVAYNMSHWKSFVNVIKTAPKSDTAVLVITFILTVAFDLVVSI